jgi:GH25 family lysozyme M1 (1,4-beta-N-acetylmuramidase)
MNELGYNAGIYASDSWMKDKLVYDRIKHLPIWNAKYNSNNGKIGAKPSNRADLHQFTSKYVPDFCNNPLDMSVVLNDDIFKKEIVPGVVQEDHGFYPIPEFTLNECLAKIGLGTDKETKRKIALANGQPNYTGALNQNLKMLEWLKAGTLKKF